MRIALGSDDDAHLVAEIARYLGEQGHTVGRFGAACGHFAETAAPGGSHPGTRVPAAAAEIPGVGITAAGGEHVR